MDSYENLLGIIYQEENCWPAEYVFSSLNYVMPDCSPEWLHQILLPPALEESMATLYSILAWRISWTEELGGLQSIGSQSQIKLK